MEKRCKVNLLFFSLIFLTLGLIISSNVSALSPYIDKEIFNYSSQDKQGIVNVAKGFSISSVSSQGGATPILIPILISADSSKNVDELVNSLRRDGFQIKYRYNLINSIAVSVPFNYIENLLDIKGVSGIYLDKEIQIPPIDKNFEQKIQENKIKETIAYSNVSLMNSIPRINAPYVWDKNIQGDGVDIAILDTGIDETHESLKGKVDAERDFTLYDGKLTVKDGHGHGTHVAGTAAGSGISTYTEINTSTLATSSSLPTNFSSLPSSWIEEAPFNHVYHVGTVNFKLYNFVIYAVVSSSAAKIVNLNITDSFVDFPHTWNVTNTSGSIKIQQPNNHTIEIFGDASRITLIKIDGINKFDESSLGWGDTNIHYKVGNNGFVKIVMKNYNVIYLNDDGNFSKPWIIVASKGEGFRDLEGYNVGWLNLNIEDNGNSASIGIDNNQDGEFNELDNLFRGVAPKAHLLIGKVCSDYGGCSTSDIIAGIEWAVSNNAKIISMSLGGLQNICDGTDPLSLAVNKASELGVTLTIAAGNAGMGGKETVASPGCANDVITVGASEDISFWPRRSAIAYFSSIGPTSDGRIKPEVLAPGVGICAPQASGTMMGSECLEGYVSASGTSMATPHVAGMVALLKEMNSSLKPNEIKDIIVNSAEDIGYNVLSQGGGIINLEKAYNRVMNHTDSVSPSILNLVVENGTSTFINLSSSINSPVIKGLQDDSELVDYTYSQGSVNKTNEFNYTFSIPSGTKTFDIRIDWSSVEYSDIDMRLFDPDNNYYGGSFGVQNFESIHVENPKEGNWKLEVYPFSVNENIIVNVTLSKLSQKSWDWFSINANKLEVKPIVKESGLYSGRVILSDNDEEVTIPTSIIVSLPIHFENTLSYDEIQNPCGNENSSSSSSSGGSGGSVIYTDNKEYAPLQGYFCSERERKAYSVNILNNIPYFDVFINAKSDSFYYGDVRLYIYGPDGEKYSSDNFGETEEYRVYEPHQGKWTVVVESEYLPLEQNSMYFKGFVSYPSLFFNEDGLHLNLKKGENTSINFSTTNVLNEDLEFSIDKLIWTEYPMEIKEQYSGVNKNNFDYSYQYYNFFVTPSMISSEDRLKISLNYNNTWGVFEMLIFDGNNTFVNSFYGYGESYVNYVNIPKNSVSGNWTLVVNSPYTTFKINLWKMNKTNWEWITTPSHIEFFRGEKNLSLTFNVPKDLESDEVIGGLSLSGSWWSGEPGHRVFSHSMNAFIPISIKINSFSDICSSNEECGEVVSGRICSGNNLTEFRFTPLCIGGMCNANESYNLIEECKNGCEGGECIKPSNENLLVINSPKINVSNNKKVLLDLKTTQKVDEISYEDLTDRTPRERRLCGACDYYNGQKSFNDGNHSLIFRAKKGGVVIDEKNTSFFVDSKIPIISKTEPRKNAFTNGKGFYVKFKEENTKKVAITFNPTISLNLNTCIESRGYTECYIDLSLSAYDGQSINYFFSVEDIVGSKAESKPILVKVDTTAPVLNNQDSFWKRGNGSYSNYIYFDMSITELNFDEAVLNYDYRGRTTEKRLCSSLRYGKCIYNFRTSPDYSNFKLIIKDDAGNVFEKPIIF